MDLLKKCFFAGLTVLSYVNPLSANQLSCISMTNKECKVRPEIINVNSDEPVFYPFSIKQVNVVVVVTILWSICKNLCSWCCKKLKC